jgi:perosamine synthetase
MTNDFIPVNTPLITKTDIAAVEECLAQGWISGEGPIVEKFERVVAKNSERQFGVAVANGTLAIDLALEAIGISKGDEVILPSFTIISCISYLLRIGAVPVFVDSDETTWNIDVGQIESRVTSNTKAILIPHIYGLPAEMDKILSIAVKYGLQVIEDAAESHGLKYKDRQCGSFGVISTFSFYANKNITTGEGGMVLTDDPVLAKKVKDLRNLNFRENERFVNDELGYNYRISSLQAALGTSQMARIDEIITRRKAIAEFYRAEFFEIENIQLPTAKTDYAENIYWVFGILLTNKLQGKAKEFQSFLAEKNIGTRPFFQPLHRQPVLEKYGLKNQIALPVAEDLGKSGFYIPNGLGLNDSQIEKVAEVVKEVFNDSRK